MIAPYVDGSGTALIAPLSVTSSILKEPDALDALMPVIRNVVAVLNVIVGAALAKCQSAASALPDARVKVKVARLLVKPSTLLSRVELVGPDAVER